MHLGYCRDGKRKEGGRFELRGRTIDGNIADGVGPIPSLFRLSVICIELVGKVSQHCVALRQDPAVYFDHWNVPRRIHFGYLVALRFRPLGEGIAHVLVSDAGIFPEQTHNLTAPSAHKVEVIERRHTADCFVSSAGGTVGICRRHFEI